MMAFFGTLIKMVPRPTPGSRAQLRGRNRHGILRTGETWLCADSSRHELCWKKAHRREHQERESGEVEIWKCSGFK
jgi:hypothetical protein